MKTVVFLDMDGTLWEWGRIPDSAREAIGQARANGHKILVNTGRTRSGVPDLGGLVDGYCMGAGSEVVLDGQTLVDVRMGEERIREIVAILDSHGFNYNLEGHERSWYRVSDEPTWQDFLAQVTSGGAALQDPIAAFGKLTDLDAVDLDDINKMFVHSGLAHYSVLEGKLPEGLALTQAGPNMAELTLTGVTKASAIDAVRDYLGEGWRTLAVGDSDNDLPMLRAADISVAMGNGNDNVKAAATWTTTPLWEDGLANAFAHYGLV